MGYWLKLYTDILDDPKYFKLSKEARLGMYELLLVAKKIENGELTGQLPCIEDIAFYTRRPVEEWQKVMPELVSVGIITDETIPTITNYAKRQDTIPNDIRCKQYKLKRNETNQTRNETNQTRNKTNQTRNKTNRVGETEKETEKKQNTETDKEKEKKSFSPKNFVGEFVNAVRVQFTNNDQPETIRDLVKDYGQDVVLQAATWYGTHNPRNMGHALSSISGMLSRGWNTKNERLPSPSQIIEQMINESEKAEVINGK